MSAGRVYRPKVKRADGQRHETSIWWLKYYVRGQVHYESSKTDSKRDAQRMLRERLAERESGKVIGRPDRVSFEDLRKGLERHYEREGNKSLKRAKQALGHLEDFFKKETLALDITRPRVEDYIAARMKVVARGTARYEVALLNASFSVAVESGLLAVRPMFKPPARGAARAGFFGDGDLAALLLELPEHLRPVVRFAALVGWRKEEVVGLTWDRVDWEGNILSLPGTMTKSGKPRSFPFGLAPELMQLLEERREQRDGLFVFHQKGQRIKTFYKAWDSACKRAGLDGRLFHDLRRTAARDLRRAGVSEAEVMRLCGWETRDMFDRYNIVDEADLAAAVAKRFPQPSVKENA